MKFKIIEKNVNSKGAIHNITFEKNLKPRIPPARKQGRPNFKWAEKRDQRILGKHPKSF